MKTGKKVKDRKNHNIFIYEDKIYKYDDIYNLIKKIKYRKSNVCNWQIINVIDCETNRKAICVLFQQTHGKLDWMHNLSFFPVPKFAYKGHENDLMYHAGFYAEYQYARDSIIKVINKKAQDILAEENIDITDIKIFVTGWSLGGSIAPICCEDIEYQSGIKPTLIAYEGANPCYFPHTRNHVMKCIAADSICFVYGKDIVPRVPAWFMGFCKLKPFIYYLKEKKKWPWLFPIIRNIYYAFKDTYRTHTEVDIGIQKHMPQEE